MAELAFFATPSDHARLIAALITQYEASFVVDAEASRQPRRLGSAEEVVASIVGNPYGARFFIVSPHWEREPLALSEVRRADGSTVTHVRGRYGGPSLDYIARHPEPDTNGPYLVASSLASFHSYYLCAGETCRPKSLEQAFSSARKVIKQGGRRTLIAETGKPGPIAMAAASSAHTSGCWIRVVGLHNQYVGNG